MKLHTLCTAVVLLAAATTAAFADTAPELAQRVDNQPTVSPPLTGGKGKPFFPSLVDPADYGYTEKEYVLSGTARTYGADGPRRPYATRMIVYRPKDASRFSGTAYLEWNNVTAQADVPVDFSWAYRHVFTSGDIYIAFAAQQVGVCGPGLNGTLPLCAPTSLKGSDPARYSALRHPGDAYSYDMFSQAARAVLEPEGRSPVGDLRVQHLIAVGESQSSAQLNLYLRYGADADARLFDGFLIDADLRSTIPKRYRVPTIHLWSEESARPIDSTATRNHRIWMVTGMAHFDRSAVDRAIPHLAASVIGVGTSRSRRADNRSLWRSGDFAQYGRNASSLCVGGTEIPRRYAVNAALAALKRWAAEGIAAPAAPSLEFTGLPDLTAQLPTVPSLPGLPVDGLDAVGIIGIPLALRRDTAGNALGGLRLPMISVPVAAYNGTGCLLLGTSTTFGSARLHRLYPTHAAYVRKIVAATQEAVRRRYLTRHDGIDLVRRACASAIPEIGDTPPEDRPRGCRSFLRRGAATT